MSTMKNITVTCTYCAKEFITAEDSCEATCIHCGTMQCILKEKRSQKSILDTHEFGECRHSPGLMRAAIKEFLLEEGFNDNNLPPEKVRNEILNTFAATVAVRSLLPPHTPMRKVIEMWDKVMLNYAAARVSHNPACLAINAATNDQEMASDIVIAQ